MLWPGGVDRQRAIQEGWLQRDEPHGASGSGGGADVDDGDDADGTVDLNGGADDDLDDVPSEGEAEA